MIESIAIVHLHHSHDPINTMKIHYIKDNEWETSQLLCEYLDKTVRCIFRHDRYFTCSVPDHRDMRHCTCIWGCSVKIKCVVDNPVVTPSNEKLLYDK